MSIATLLPSSEVCEIRLQGIQKYFGSIPALAGVDLTLNAGEVHALLGENGAGKSTLMKILYGLYRPDAGTIYFDHHPVKIASAAVAMQLGLGFVQQHFSLVDILTVAENIVLGTQPRFFYAPATLQQQIQAFININGFALEAGAPVSELSVGKKQRVEIIKALYRQAKFIIFDEPTSVLAPQEVETLFATIRRLQAEGKGIVFITHKLDEVLQISNRITILRAGKNVAALDTRSATAEHLARLMIGEIIPPVQPSGRKTTGAPSVLLQAKNLQIQNDRGHLAVNDISFELAAGEILGVAGVDGSGQRELAEAIMGLRAVQAGIIQWKLFKTASDSPIQESAPTDKSGQQIIKAINPLAASIRWKIFFLKKSKTFFDRRRLGFIPPDRLSEAFVPDFSLAENSLLERSDDHEFRRAGFLAAAKINQHAKNIIENFNVACKGPEQKLRELSGGNQQKFLLGRALSTNPEVLVAMNPTWGVDAAATAAIHARLRNMQNRGGAILLFSTDLEEIYALCDRFFVMHTGRLMGWATAATSATQVGLWMTGRPSATIH
jgi:simple sugar transport system ATP-binding protein